MSDDREDGFYWVNVKSRVRMPKSIIAEWDCGAWWETGTWQKISQDDVIVLSDRLPSPPEHKPVDGIE